MNKRIILLIGQLKSNLQSPPTVKELATQFNISESRLRQLFKEETGISFNKYILDIRLERACELLETTFMRVQEISTAIGIYDQCYFNRIFKERYNLTPNKYRDENHKDFLNLKITS